VRGRGQMHCALCAHVRHSHRARWDSRDSGRYPFSPPEMKFVPSLFHPNVYADGKICISILHPPGDVRPTATHPVPFCLFFTWQSAGCLHCVGVWKRIATEGLDRLVDLTGRTAEKSGVVVTSHQKQCRPLDHGAALRSALLCLPHSQS
jgi:hypothetical protein